MVNCGDKVFKHGLRLVTPELSEHRASVQVSRLERLAELEALAAGMGRPPYSIQVSLDARGKFGARNIRDADGKWVANASKPNIQMLCRVHEVLALAREALHGSTPERLATSTTPL